MQNLWQILQKLKPQFSSFSKKLQEAKALGFWEQAVGAQIAKHAKAYKVEDGILFIEVDHPAWQAELHARRKQIVALLNSTIQKEFNAPSVKTSNATITGMYFIVGSMRISKQGK